MHITSAFEATSKCLQRWQLLRRKHTIGSVVIEESTRAKSNEQQVDRRSSSREISDNNLTGPIPADLANAAKLYH
ncbi:hypothetical protein L6452_32854 [Arctium lappa]|uniref:Uncharacterized protein n=1 Tax=Arctium lappa TaxID=4217 RepID=A0ACB8Z652_ARCLA|nr:hypothetical protein L6452_32854 [Arctium lappa]